MKKRVFVVLLNALNKFWNFIRFYTSLGIRPLNISDVLNVPTGAKKIGVKIMALLGKLQFGILTRKITQLSAMN